METKEQTGDQEKARRKALADAMKAEMNWGYDEEVMGLILGITTEMVQDILAESDAVVVPEKVAVRLVDPLSRLSDQERARRKALADAIRAEMNRTGYSNFQMAMHMGITDRAVEGYLAMRYSTESGEGAELVKKYLK